jgi:hypothetical protein
MSRPVCFRVFRRRDPFDPLAPAASNQRCIARAIPMLRRLIASVLDVLTIGGRLGRQHARTSCHLFKTDDHTAAIIEKALAGTEEG